MFGLAFFLSPTMLKVYAAIALVAVVAILKHGYDERRRDEGREEVRHEELAPLQAKFDAAQKRATDMALLWAAQLEKTAEQSRQREEANRVASTAFAERAKKLPSVPSCNFTPESVRLWGDITRSANAADATAQSTTTDAGARAQAVSESALGEYVNRAAEAYKDAVGLFHEARDALRACVNSFVSTGATP